MKKTKVYLTDIEKQYPEKDYLQIYNHVCNLINNKELTPIKTAKTNGRKPSLPLAFWHYEKEYDYSDVFEELDYKLHPLINTQYYKKYPDKYKQDAHNIRLLSNYLKNNSSLLSVEETMNERSFEIFKREKFFQKEGGLKFCERLGIDKTRLNFYETYEPLSYYSQSKKSPQNILIVENKDTFYDIRRYIQGTNNTILGVQFGTVIYGAGKGIWKTFLDYVNGAESYFTNDNKLFYFGDIDYEGIIIYEHLVRQKWINVTGKNIHIKPFINAYKAMVSKAEKFSFDELPYTKEKQNTNMDNIFFDFFDEHTKCKILEILKSGRYIPQEILNEHDWSL